MSNPVLEEVGRRNAQTTAGTVVHALEAALRDVLSEMAREKGSDWVDAFLERRLQIAESMRAPRAHEPAALATVRMRDAAAVEAALRAVGDAVRRATGSGI